MSSDNLPVKSDTHVRVKKVNGKKGDINNATVPHEEIVENKRKTVSKYNAFKHGRRAKSLPLLCNNCNYRPEELGGGGQCKSFKADSVCMLSKEFEEYFSKYDTRDPEQLKTINDTLLKRQLTKIFMSEQQYAWDGGVPDKAHDRQIHVYIDLLKLQKELVVSKMVASETVTTGTDANGNSIQQIFRSLVLPNSKKVDSEVNDEDSPNTNYGNMNIEGD